MPEYRRYRGAEGDVHRGSLVASTPFEREVLTACGYRSALFELTDAPLTCGECKVHAFLADVRAAQVRRRIAERQPGPTRLEIGPAARDKLRMSRTWHELLGWPCVDDPPDRIFGVPVTYDDLMVPADGWRMLDADGEQIGRGEL